MYDDRAKIATENLGVPSAIGGVDREIATLLEKIEILGGRLLPVLGPSRPTGPAGDSAPLRNGAPRLSEAINHLAERIRGGIHAIEDISERLEL